MYVLSSPSLKSNRLFEIFLAINIPTHSVMESKGQVLDEIISYSGDVWEEICDQVDIDYEEYQILNTTEGK